MRAKAMSVMNVAFCIPNVSTSGFAFGQSSFLQLLLSIEIVGKQKQVTNQIAIWCVLFETGSLRIYA